MAFTKGNSRVLIVIAVCAALVLGVVGYSVWSKSNSGNQPGASGEIGWSTNSTVLSPSASALAPTPVGVMSLSLGSKDSPEQVFLTQTLTTYGNAKTAIPDPSGWVGADATWVSYPPTPTLLSVVALSISVTDAAKAKTYLDALSNNQKTFAYKIAGDNKTVVIAGDKDSLAAASDTSKGNLGGEKTVSDALAKVRRPEGSLIGASWIDVETARKEGGKHPELMFPWFTKDEFQLILFDKAGIRKGFFAYAETSTKAGPEVSGYSSSMKEAPASYTANIKEPNSDLPNIPASTLYAYSLQGFGPAIGNIPDVEAGVREWAPEYLGGLSQENLAYLFSENATFAVTKDPENETPGFLLTTRSSRPDLTYTAMQLIATGSIQMEMGKAPNTLMIERGYAMYSSPTLAPNEHGVPDATVASVSPEIGALLDQHKTDFFASFFASTNSVLGLPMVPSAVVGGVALSGEFSFSARAPYVYTKPSPSPTSTSTPVSDVAVPQIGFVWPPFKADVNALLAAVEGPIKKQTVALDKVVASWPQEYQNAIQPSKGQAHSFIDGFPISAKSNHALITQPEKFVGTWTAYENAFKDYATQVSYVQWYLAHKDNWGSTDYQSKYSKAAQAQGISAAEIDANVKALATYGANKDVMDAAFMSIASANAFVPDAVSAGLKGLNANPNIVAIMKAATAADKALSAK